MKFTQENLRGSRLLWPLCALIGLSACTHTAISPQAEDPAAPETWARAGETGHVVTNWLRDFNDPRLVSLVQETVASNHSLAQERARLAQQQESVVAARANKYPNLDISIDSTRRGSEAADGTSIVTSNYAGSAGASWNVDLWGKLSAEQRATRLSMEAQRARVQQAERQLAAGTARLWFAAIQAKTLLAVAERRLENVVQSEQIVSSGYRAGLNDALDLYLARNQVDREQANLAQQRQRVFEAVADLQLTLARYPDGRMEAESGLPVVNDPVPTGLPSELLSRRADLQEAWLRLLAADASLAAAHKSRFPSLVLVGSAGVASADIADLLQDGSDSWSLVAGLTQPLFQSGRLAALERQAAERVHEVEQQYLELVYTAFAEVEDAISRDVSLRERYESFLDAEKNSSAALRLALDQYQRGLVTYTTVLESQRQAFDAEATVVGLRNELLQNRIDLYLALGGEFSTN